MRLSPILCAGAGALAAALLAGCSASDTASENRACKAKWETVLNLARCTFDIEPPPGRMPPEDR
jgi:hypothetical protein